MNLQNLLTAYAAQYQKKKKNPIKNWAEDLNLKKKKKNTDGQEAHEKMLNITNY